MVSQILCLIFMQSLATSEIPDDWKIGRIVAVFKTGERTNPANYRPISLTSIPSKLLEHIISSHIATHLESINFFYNHQHGFRKHFSCETQLAEFTHDLLKSMDDNLQIDAIFLDFSKAFDRLPHNLLLSKINSLGIAQNIVSWIKHFLSNRKQFTSANNHNSSKTHVSSGVPQGAGLSPLLFLIFINDLPTNIQTKLRLFANDCVIYSPIHNFENSTKLQQDLDTVALWCQDSSMPLNLTKCKSMSFSRKRTTVHHTYFINSLPLDSASSYKYLGVHMYPSLSFAPHVQSICSDALRTLGFLRRNLKSGSSDVKKLAYLTYVRPKLEYASSIWNPSQVYLVSELEAVQNRAARFITSQYSREISVTALKQSIELPSLASRRLISRLCLLHSFFFRPQSRHELLQPPNRTSSRINHSNPIARINGRTSPMNDCFFPQAITLWNRLPDTIVATPDRTSFRAKLKSHFDSTH